MSHQNSSVSLTDVLLDASQYVNDVDMIRAGGRPFYVTQAARAMRKMGFDTLFDLRRTDIDITGLVLDQPAGSISLDELFVYSGSECDFDRARIVRVKSGMFNRGGSNFLARNMWRNSDILQWNAGWSSAPPRCLYFCGAENGKLYLSASCLNFEKLHIAYYGTGIDQCAKDFDIPEWMAEAVTDFIILQAANRLYKEDPTMYLRIIRDKQLELNVNNTAGSWHQARVYKSRMDPKTRKDMIQYMTRNSPR